VPWSGDTLLVQARDSLLLFSHGRSIPCPESTDPAYGMPRSISYLSSGTNWLLTDRALFRRERNHWKIIMAPGNTLHSNVLAENVHGQGILTTHLWEVWEWTGSSGPVFNRRESDNTILIGDIGPDGDVFLAN